MRTNAFRQKLAVFFPTLFKLSQKVRVFILSRKTPDEIFTDFYKKIHWKNSESVSGIGSTLKQTEILRKKLPILIASFKIDSILDLPCGDFNWMKECNLGIKKYIGGDIVNELIEVNNMQYKSNIVSFNTLNLISDKLPEADLLFCRDCLVHLSFTNIKEIFDNIKKQKNKYVMITTFPNLNTNVDIVTGRWRPLNFEKAPFNMPQAIDTIEEDDVSGELKKCMGIWKREDIGFFDKAKRA